MGMFGRLSAPVAPLTTSRGYRPEIDSLRAIAVVTVVLYHFDIGPLPGGFIGVDVFYVISGYLITQIIWREIEQGTFTFAGFYERRVRRIAPALLVLLLATLLVAAFLFLPTDLKLLGQSSVATVIFSSNIYFSATAGYFTSVAGLSPLLHMWTLAVEEQFYIVLPLVLLLVRRRAPTHVQAALGAIALASFAACVWMQGIRPTSSFFLLQYRGWELMVGALLGVGAVPAIRDQALRELAAAAGVAMILGTSILLESEKGFPGWIASVPVLGAALFIHAGESGTSLAARLLGWKPILYIGLISYSLYLWHWPVAVFTRYANQLAPLGDEKYLLVAISLALAAASYHLVELPVRTRAWFGTRRALFNAFLLGSLLVAGLGAVAMLSRGLPQRVSAEVAAVDAERDPEIPHLDCVTRNRERAVPCPIGVADGRAPTVALWGDSFALAWAPAFDRFLEQRGQAGVYLGRAACPPLVGVVNPTRPRCRPFNDNVVEYLGANPELRAVILLAAWNQYAPPDGIHQLQDLAGKQGNVAIFGPALARTIEQLRALGKQVWLLGPTPDAPADMPLHLAIALRSGTPVPLPTPTAAHRERSQHFVTALASLPAELAPLYSDPALWLCDADACRYAGADGLPLYRDTGHLSVRGAQSLVPELQRAAPAFVPAAGTR